jgi:aspartyl-tRNA synthetase
MDRTQSADFYRRYITCWNARRLDELLDYVAADIQVNGEHKTPAQYVAGMDEVFLAVPDFHWDLQHLLVDGAWISAHFTVTGTHQGPFRGIPATGRSIATQEFAVYRLDDGRIAEFWGTVDNAALLDQLRS